MPIISIEIVKIIDEKRGVMQGVLLWYEVVAKCNKDNKRY